MGFCRLGRNEVDELAECNAFYILYVSHRHGMGATDGFLYLASAKTEGLKKDIKILVVSM